jgi:hypothetical protein
MKILLLTINQDKSVLAHFNYWYEALGKVCDLTVRKRDFISLPKAIKNPNNIVPFIRDTKKRTMSPLIKLENVNNNYDVVITDHSYAFYTEEWNKIKIPKIMIIEDSSNGPINKQIRASIKCKFDVLFCRYRQEFFKYQKSYADKFAAVRWLPHAVNLDVFKDYGLEKKYDVTMTGYHFPPYYHWRDLMFDEIEDKEYFTELRHLGYNKETKGSVNGVEFAKFLNQSKISISCGLIFNRLVMKFFEIPAVRTLLFSNMFDDMRDLGFKDGENMVVADIGNIDKQLRNLLADNDMIKEISNNGYEFITKNHSNEIRAKQFIEDLQAWL